MDLLYRKRIKSNYDNIDPFLSEEFEGGPLVLKCICNIVYQLNYAFETYICKAIGTDYFSEIVEANYKNYNFAYKRAQTILQINMTIDDPDKA